MSGRWRVYVLGPRRGQGKNLRMRARWVEGPESKKDQELSANTTERGRAKELARAWEKQLNTSASVLETLDDLMAARIADMERDPTKSPSSVSAAKNARARLEDVLGRIRIEDLEGADILRARAALRDEGLSPATTKTYLATAAASWRWCEMEGHVTKPWPKVRRMKAPARRPKRPFTDREIILILDWARTYQRGRWRPLLELLASTGRRVSELLELRGRDLDRHACTIRVQQKRGGQHPELTIPVPPRVMDTLPQAKPHLFVFGQWGRGGTDSRANQTKHPDRSSVTALLRRAIKALGIPGGERLDVHSFRRAWVASAERVGVAIDVGRRITGHETRAMWEHYQAEAVGDDLRGAVMAVDALRQGVLVGMGEGRGRVGEATEKPSPRQSPSSPRGDGSLNPVTLAFQSLRPESNRQPHHYESGAEEAASPADTPFSPSVEGDCGADIDQHRPTSSAEAEGRVKPHHLRIARWAEEDPPAMGRLLQRQRLRQMTLDAMRERGMLGEAA